MTRAIFKPFSSTGPSEMRTTPDGGSTRQAMAVRLDTRAWFHQTGNWARRRRMMRRSTSYSSSTYSPWLVGLWATVCSNTTPAFCLYLLPVLTFTLLFFLTFVLLTVYTVFRRTTIFQSLVDTYTHLPRLSLIHTACCRLGIDFLPFSYPLISISINV